MLIFASFILSKFLSLSQICAINGSILDQSSGRKLCSICHSLTLTTAKLTYFVFFTTSLAFPRQLNRLKCLLVCCGALQSIETTPLFDQWSLKIEFHWKNICVNGQSTKNHSMVMVSSKTIEICNSTCKTVNIFNGLLGLGGWGVVRSILAISSFVLFFTSKLFHPKIKTHLLLRALLLLQIWLPHRLFPASLLHSPFPPLLTSG